MKTMLLAAAAVLSLGVGSAYAGESGAQPGSFQRRMRRRSRRRRRTGRRCIPMSPSRAAAPGCSRQPATLAPTANPEGSLKRRGPAPLPAFFVSAEVFLLQLKPPGRLALPFAVSRECRIVPRGNVLRLG
jgi:hypothetical protein